MSIKKKKGPGKYFRRGLSMIEIAAMFPDDRTAEQWFTEQRWPDGAACPQCGSVNVQERPTRKPQPYRCRDCRKDFSVRTGTLMHGSNLGYKKWAWAVYLMTTNLKGVSSMKLHRDVGVTQKTAWYLAHRIRETWEDGTLPFAGPVEVDETYIGGKAANRPLAKRRWVGGGVAGKSTVVGVKNRDTNQVSAKVLPNRSKPYVHGFIRDQVKTGSQIYTDECRAYLGLHGDYRHSSVQHKLKQYVDGQAHTNGIESFWSLLKRGYMGTFHRLSPKHLQRYITEFSGRHNQRSLDTREQMGRMARGLDRKRLRYQDLIA